MPPNPINLQGLEPWMPPNPINLQGLEPWMPPNPINLQGLGPEAVRLAVERSRAGAPRALPPLALGAAAGGAAAGTAPEPSRRPWDVLWRTVDLGRPHESSKTCPHPRGLARPEIVDFLGLNGPLLPQNPLEKVGGFAPHLFQ